MSKPQTIRRFTVCVCFCLVFVQPVLAWNNVGHRVVAELVWRQMDASQRAAASALLRNHPHYETLLLERVPAGVSKEEWAFLTAAVWPDMVRPAKAGQPEKSREITKYDLYPHAVGYPIVWPQNKNKVSIEHFSVGNPDAEQVLSNSLAVLHDHKATPADRAVSLCWVLHLTADLHQPLHAATIVSPEKPRGDGLGGWYIVRDLKGRKTNLHSFWDELPGIDPSYASVSRVANEIAATRELKAGKLSEYEKHRTIHSWVRESYDYVVNFAYNPQRVRYAHIDDLDSGKLGEAKIPRLTKAYAGEARKIALGRLALAALRLSDELKQVW